MILAALAAATALAAAVVRWLASADAAARISAERARLASRGERAPISSAVRVLLPHEQRPDPKARPCLCSPSSPKGERGRS